jgi:hypothetical protein
VKTKVLLRNQETGQYYLGSKGWSANAAMAQDFDTVESASNVAWTQRLSGLEVVLRYEDPACDLVLPLRQEC